MSALEGVVARSEWDTLPSRVGAAVDRLRELLAEHDARATWFVLGWIAERHPALVRDLVADGHEVASHGWDHRRVSTQTQSEFRACVRRSRAVLEDVSGQPVHGYRAPSYSIVPGREWALDVLVEEGYRYDSSLFPVRRRGYGFPGGPRDPHQLARPAGLLAEVPPATARVAGINLPAAGGAWFRLLPYALTRTAFEQAARRGVPATFYIHPWEIDADQPRLAVPALARIRHYGGLARMPYRLRRLLAAYRFRAIGETLGLRRPVSVVR